MDDEYDQYFDDLPWDEIIQILDDTSRTLTAPTTQQWASSSKTAASSRPSTQLTRPQQKPSRHEFRSAASLQADFAPTKKRGRSPEQESPEVSLKKMKLYAQKVLKVFEEDFTCPICFDLIVACHLTNPCGHSACGSCSKKWAANKSKPTCFACRAPLHRTTPVIPGLLMDSLIEKQINSLAENGDEEWALHGTKKKEWDQRKAAWVKEKTDSQGRARRLETIRRAMTVPAEVVTLSEDDSDEDEDDVDDDDDDEEEDGDVAEIERDIANVHRLLGLMSGRVETARQTDILRYPRVSRQMIQNLPVADNPNDADYVPDTQVPASGSGDRAVRGRRRR